jgi:hypothetical protein
MRRLISAYISTMSQGRPPSELVAAISALTAVLRLPRARAALRCRRRPRDPSRPLEPQTGRPSYGGSIEVDTLLGEFTEFRIVLPRGTTTNAISGERA